jgi:hypothetical protein
MPSYFLADGLIHEVLKLGVVAVTEESADLKAQLATFCNSPGDELRGVVVRAQIADHRNTNRPFMIGYRFRDWGG